MKIYLSLVLCVLANIALLSGEEIQLEDLLHMAVEPEVILYKKTESRNLHLYVYKPKLDAPPNGLPALMVIHGGGWSAPGLEHMRPLCQYVALRGMIAVNIEYRLVSKTNQIRVEECMADSRDALRYLQTHAKNLGIDPSRIGVAGDSSGGHLAATLALSMGFENTALKAPATALLYNPALDLTTLPWMKNHASLAPRAEAKDVAEEDWYSRAQKASPLHHMKKNIPPIMLMHGTADRVINVKQSDLFYQQCKKLKTEVCYHRMENWNHAFIVAGYGRDEEVVESLKRSYEYLVSLGWIKGKSTIQRK